MNTDFQGSLHMADKQAFFTWHQMQEKSRDEINRI